MSMMVVNHIVHNVSDVSFGKGIQTNKKCNKLLILIFFCDKILFLPYFNIKFLKKLHLCSPPCNPEIPCSVPSFLQIGRSVSRKNNRGTVPIYSKILYL